MIQKMYFPALHTTLRKAFSPFIIFSFYLFFILGFQSLPAQDITGLEVVRSLHHPGNYSVGKMDTYFDSSHQLIAYASEQGTWAYDTLVIYDFGRDSVLAKIHGYGLVSGINFIDETQLLCVMKDTLWRITGIGSIIIREVLGTGMRAMRLSHHMSTLAFVLYDNGQQYIGIAAYDTASAVLGAIDTLGSSEVSIDEYLLIDFAPGDDYFAIGGGYEHAFVEVVKVASGSLHKVEVAGIESTYSPAFFYQDGRLKLAVGGGYYNGAIVVIDIAMLTQESMIPVFQHYNYAITFDQTGRYMVCGGYDGILRLFEVTDTDFSEIETYDVGILRSLQFTSDDQYLLSGYQASAGPRMDIHRVIRQPTAVGTLISMPLILYPNPTAGRVYMEGFHNALVMVYDRTGRMVMSAREAGDGIDVGQLPSGMYILSAIDNQVMRVGRFIKE